MTEDTLQNQTGLNRFLLNPNIDEYIFISLIVASFLGELIINASLLIAFIYWILITPFFFIASILSEKAKTLRTGREIAHLIKYELFYWGSAFAAVLLIFLLWSAGRLDPSEASIVIHIILAHTMFLTGIVLGLRFYLIGILLFITAGFNITSELATNFSLDIVVMAAVAFAGLKIKSQFILPILKRDSDFTTNPHEYSGDERRNS